MPTYRPGTLGPALATRSRSSGTQRSRRCHREQLAELQLSRAAGAGRRVLKNPVPLFERKLREAGVERADDIGSVDDINSIPTHGQAGAARLRGVAAPVRRLPLHRPTRVRSARHVDRHDRHADDRAVDPPGHLARVRVRGAGLVAQRLASRPDRHPRAPRVPLRRRRHAVGQPRVLRRCSTSGWRRPTPTSSPSRAIKHVAAGARPTCRWSRSTSVGSRRWRPSSASTSARTWGCRVPAHARLRRQGPADDDRGRSSATPSSAGRAARTRARTSTRTGRSCRPSTRRPAREVPDGEWGNLVVTTLDRDNGLLRYDLEEAAAHRPRALPVRRDDDPRLVGRALQGPARRARASTSRSARSRARCATVAEVNQPTLEYVVVKPTDDAAPLAHSGRAARRRHRPGSRPVHRRHQATGRHRCRCRDRGARIARTQRLQGRPTGRCLTARR